VVYASSGKFAIGFSTFTEKLTRLRKIGKPIAFPKPDQHRPTDAAVANRNAEMWHPAREFAGCANSARHSSSSVVLDRVVDAVVSSIGTSLVTVRLYWSENVQSSRKSGPCGLMQAAAYKREEI
jgi:hypothetical protein